MKFTSYQIKGKGRGKTLGFPTINLAVPEGFRLQKGVYAVRMTMSAKTYPGVLHWGPIPTFHEPKAGLEVFLLQTPSMAADMFDFPLTVTVVRRIRPVRAFSSQDALTKQIAQDVSFARSFLF